MKRGSSKTVILNKIEQRRTQHFLVASGEFAVPENPVPPIALAGADDASASQEDNGLGSSPSMTKKLKKAFKPSTISRSSSVRGSRANTPVSPPSPSVPLSARVRKLASGSVASNITLILCWRFVRHPRDPLATAVSLRRVAQQQSVLEATR